MGVVVIRIEYEILPSMNNWIAFVAAFSHEEAVAHLQKVIGKPIRITASGAQCRLDDLSTQVRQNVVNAYLSSNPGGVGVVKNSVEDDRPTNTDEIPPVGKPETTKVVAPPKFVKK